VGSAHFSESITLRVPSAYAFDFLADPSTAQIIDPAVIEYQPDELPMRQGVRVKIRMRAWGVPTRIESVVAEWVPGRYMVMQGVRPTRPMTVTATHKFDSSPEGCTYSWAMTFEPNAPLGRFVVTPSCRFMRRNARRQQQLFKSHVESRWQAEPSRD
jgi:Polyketide cyclase / dehydrase and lipid transport